MTRARLIGVICLAIMMGCKPADTSHKPRIVFDTDANNELDDQHALAYLLFNQKAFDVSGITINATRGGGNIDFQYAEADRVVKLCKRNEVPLFKGANKNFDTLQYRLDTTNYDGQAAVDFIVHEARLVGKPKLTVIAVGKLTTIAMLLKKYPTLEDSIHLVWLGSNYPDGGEYNLDNDTVAVNFVARTNIEMDIVTVRYGKTDGSDVVRLTPAEVAQHMTGKGPKITPPVEGRHGGSFERFGDYSVNLFEHIHYNGNPPGRALYDMVAVAIVKNPAWGKATVVNGPVLINNHWIEHPQSNRKVTVWRNFDKKKILKDFFETIDVADR